MKKTILIICAIVVLLASIWYGRQWYVKNLFNHAGKGTVAFSEIDLNSALELCKAQNQVLFIDAYATWCGPCRNMAKTTFRNLELANYFNAKYINVSIDVDSEIGKEFSLKYQIEFLPTLLFINAKGEVLQRIEGFQSAEAMLNLARKIE